MFFVIETETLLRQACWPCLASYFIVGFNACLVFFHFGYIFNVGRSSICIVKLRLACVTCFLFQLYYFLIKKKTQYTRCHISALVFDSSCFYYWSKICSFLYKRLDLALWAGPFPNCKAPLTLGMEGNVLGSCSGWENRWSWNEWVFIICIIIQS